MVKHVYLYKLLPGVEPAEIHEMEVALGFKRASNSYDLIECCTFLTMDDFLRFGKNDYHELIRQYMDTVRACGVKIDYEI